MVMGAAVVSTACIDPGPKNVILITLDTTRADFIGAYGCSDPISPNIDELASRGVVYEDAYSTAPFTGPAHASILTAQHPSRHGILYNGHKVPGELSPGSVSLSEHLAGYGFRTGAVVSSGVLGKRYGFGRGFGFYRLVVKSPPNENGGSAASVTAEAIRWLKASNGDPFFLWVHYVDPHLPYTVAEKVRKQLEIRDPLVTLQTGNNLPTERLRQAYAAEIYETDVGVGELLSHLKNSESEDTTLVVLTADHGEYLHEHEGFMDHFGLFEQVLHVPLIIAGPGVPEGQRRRGLVSVIDIAPTIADALGLPPLSQADGISHWGFAEQLDVDRAVFAEWRHFNLIDQPERVSKAADFLISVQVGSKKLIRPVLAPEETTVFDIDSDLDERNSLTNESYELTASLEAILDAHIQDDLPAGVATGGEAEIDKESIEMLRAMGYLQ